MELLERSGFVLFAKREIELIMDSATLEELTDNKDGVEIDFSALKQRWDKMSGRKRNLYNKEAEKQKSYIQHASTNSKILKTPFDYYSEVNAALKDEDQKKLWRQLSFEAKQVYYNKALKKLETIKQRPRPIPKIKNGKCKLWTAFHFFRDSAIREAMLQNKDITPDVFDICAKQIWNGMPIEQKQIFYYNQTLEIESVSARAWKEGMNTRPDLCLQTVLSYISKTPYPRLYTSKYWCFVDGSIIDIYDESMDPDELAEIACEQWYSVESHKNEKEIDLIENQHFEKRAKTHKIPKEFLERITDILWHIRGEYSKEMITKYAEDCWNEMNPEEKKYFLN